MVRESWSVEKKACEEKKFREIQAERVRQYNRLKNTSKFTVHAVTTTFDRLTDEPYDYLTMRNGDTYEGKRKELADYIISQILKEVDQLLGLQSPSSSLWTLSVRMVLFHFGFYTNEHWHYGKRRLVRRKKE